MKEFWYTIQFIFTVLGGWLGYFLGGCDGLLIALVAFAGKHHRCAGHRHRQRTQDGSDILLSIE